MIGITNACSGGSGGTLTVKAPPNVTVTAEREGRTYTRTANAAGTAVFRGLSTGTLNVTISDGVQKPVTRPVTITADYEVQMAFFLAYISVTYPEGSTCTCTKGGLTLTAEDTSGAYTFTVPEAGDWVIHCTDGTQENSFLATVSENEETVEVAINFYFHVADLALESYGELGVNYEVLYDDDTAIPQNLWYTVKDWKVRFLTSNTEGIVPLKDGKIDVMAVGGGSAGPYGTGTWKYSYGGSIVIKTVDIITGTKYPISIGAGGKNSDKNQSPGGKTSAFGTSANGGAVAVLDNPQAKTYEWKGTSGRKYGGSRPKEGKGEVNTGEAGGPTYTDGWPLWGGSGIVIIRNTRGGT